MSDEILGAFNDFSGFQLLLRERREELKISFVTLNANMLTEEGHAEKMLADPPAKNMGITSFGKLMKNLGVKGLLLVDETQMRKIADQLVLREERAVRVPNAVRHGPIILRFTRRYMQKLGRLSGEARKRIPNWKRKAMARHAARVRWQGKKAKPKIL